MTAAVGVLSAGLPWLTERARLDQLHRQGQAAGLTREQVDEVIDTWNRWYQQTPWPLNWDRVRGAIVLRAVGQERAPARNDAARGLAPLATYFDEATVGRWFQVPTSLLQSGIHHVYNPRPRMRRLHIAYRARVLARRRRSR